MVFFGLGTVAYISLLLVNSVAILNKERFLAPLGLTYSNQSTQQTTPNSNYQPGAGYGNGFESFGNVQGNVGGGGGGDEMGVKMRAIMLVDAVRTIMRSQSNQVLPECDSDRELMGVTWACAVPLIPINIVVIVYELLLGSGF